MEPKENDYLMFVFTVKNIKENRIKFKFISPYIIERNKQNEFV